ncbi:MAG: hypothetical protein FWG10_04215 [Eubacteriaceae bacterium]|nr:hypothetical protein [Eubacteriaceae bacterium]
MLKDWTLNAEYRQTLNNRVNSLTGDDQARFNLKYGELYQRMLQLDLDPAYEVMAPLYSNTGRPAELQMEALRSYIAMLLQGEASVTSWVEELRADPLLAMACGLQPWSSPSVGSFYGISARLWGGEAPKAGELHSPDIFKKPKDKPKDGEKLVPKDTGAKCEALAKSLMDGAFEPGGDHWLQLLFSALAVGPTAEMGIVDMGKAIVCGDGTAVHTTSSPNGKRVCEHKGTDEKCACPRHYTDPLASWGFDTDTKQFYFGYSAYNLTVRNKDYGLDIPILLSLNKAEQHDSVSLLEAFGKLDLYSPNISLYAFAGDSAHDNMATYKLLASRQTAQAIDINKRRAHGEFNGDGNPVCEGGFEMAYDGSGQKSGRLKFRCPLVMGKCDSCGLWPCTNSRYGKVIHVPATGDIRRYPKIKRESEEFKSIYKDRTSTERVNNRILNDYNLHSLKIRHKGRYAFYLALAGICVHLDARVKAKRKQEEAA